MKFEFHRNINTFMKTMIEKQFKMKFFKFVDYNEFK
ncbi:hypothetical protein LCGC14_1063750 [marine sediment metagenome]|uniref:Uncharacterized protein n=1 Tax=marine sediment metagenome TaxID=412755 RepID=A0A0F9MK76_9ZZZZ